MLEPSILTILALIQKRPSMYLGWDDTKRREQLHALQAVLTGYAMALQQHRVGNADLAALTEFEEFLRQRSGADNFCGIDQILATSQTEHEAWDRVWALLDEFRELKGHTI